MEFGWGLTNILTPALYAGCMLAILLTLFYRIEIGIYVFVFFLPLQNILDYVIDFPLGKDINDLLILSMLIRWILDRNKNSSFFHRTPFDIPLMLLTAWTFISVWHGAQYIGAPISLLPIDPRIMAWKNYLIPFILFYIMVNNLKRPLQIKICVMVMLGSILILDRNFYNIIKYVDTSHYSESFQHLGTPSSLSGNFLAVFLASYSVFLITLFLYDKNVLRKIVYAGLGGLSYYCIMFLFSRSGYLAAFSSWAFIGLVKNRKILLVVILVTFFWQSVLPLSVRERIEMTKTEDGYDGTTLERLGMWQQAKMMIAENPIMGAGFDITRQLTITDGGLTQYTWQSFHNNYLQTTVEMGYIGLALVLSLFLLGAYCGWRLTKISGDAFEKGLGVGMIGCTIATLAGNFAGSYWHFFNIIGFYWVALALVVKSIQWIEPNEPKPTERVSKVQVDRFLLPYVQTTETER
ncbi:MAG TPA: O-antigen ligase family protein [bacterium]|nr:O-antigen ligase family protein [bacterium]HNT64677.1 O-antigen ligase family protein [bacterium]HOX85838.1 O-antigen ligase family protein [bacterium]HPG45179.1 O-antigen ligase family protein [bacterium]HPM97421.1 O-antigen ligase family protein [bacterium]